MSRTGGWATIPATNMKIALIARCTDCEREMAVMLAHGEAVPDRCNGCAGLRALRDGKTIRMGAE